MADAIDDPTIPPLLGADRFQPYVAVCGSAADAIRLYAWNLEASAALWGGFAILEVCLRNAINARLSSLAGRGDWWNAASLHLHRDQRQRVNEAVSRATLEQGTAVTDGHVVAQLTLGFWVSLLTNRYHSSLWVPAVSHAFPHWALRRGDLHHRLETLRKVRNRLAHHEKVFNRNLLRDHQDVLDVLAAIEPAVRDWVAHDSRLPAVLAVRATTIAGQRPTSF